MRAQDDWDWEKFTAITAREAFIEFIDKGIPHDRAEKQIAERAVRWAIALTKELRNKLGEQ